MKRIIFGLCLLCCFQSVSAENTLTYGMIESINSTAFSSLREFSVRLPESYEAARDKKYPVLYVLHGQWDLLPTVAVVDAISNIIPELIIVGVHGEGMELRPATGANDSINSRGMQFRSFVIDELVPHVNQNYRVADFSILSGHSNSGRFVLNSFLDDPRVFDAYFAFSPSLDDEMFNRRVMQNELLFTDNHSKLVMTLADEGEHMQVPYRQLIALFDEGRPASTEFFHKEFPQQTHASTQIVSMLYSLRTLFDDWQPPAAVQQEGLAGLQRHYSGLTEKYGFSVQIPLHYILRIAYFYSAADDAEKNQKAAELVHFALDRDSGSIEDLEELIVALTNQGQQQGAERVIAAVCGKVREFERCAGK